MAGSSPPFSNESSLLARMEGLKLLAHHLTEPVVVFNPRMELVYANPSAERIASHCPLLHSLSLDVDASGSCEMIQCESCPGPSLFQEKLGTSEEWHSNSSPRLLSSCPLQQAMPLKSEDGTVHFAVMMGVTARESVVLDSSELPQSSSNKGLRARALCRKRKVTSSVKVSTFNSWWS